MPRQAIDLTGLNNFEPVPTGTYTVEVSSHEAKTTSTNKLMDVFQLTIVQGDCAGKKLFLNLVDDPKSHFMTAAFAEACIDDFDKENVAFVFDPESEPELYLNKTIVVEVELTSYTKDGKQVPSNNIKKLLRYD